jgi:hypothetical protein
MNDQSTVPPTRRALEEALTLSETILRNIELTELPLANIALKAIRLARLLNDFEMQQIFQFEVAGYPSTPSGVPHAAFQLALKANRGYKRIDTTTKEEKQVVHLESIEQLEHEIEMAQSALRAAADRDISISSSNPHQNVFAPMGNAMERRSIREAAQAAARRLSARRTLIHEYALTKHYELKFSGIADDIFSRIRERVDSAIGAVVPDAVNMLGAVYDNLRSDNTEDWSNAVHSCRRILQQLADAVYPAREDRAIHDNVKKKVIKLGKDNYINRLIAYMEDRSSSERFQHIVGSHLGFLGDRLDSVFQAAQKGSHDVIVSREEADRYVVYTYLAVGDILTMQ